MEKFDKSAREVIVLAVNMAAERHDRSVASGDKPESAPMKLTALDVKRAYRLICKPHGFNGTFAAGLEAKLKAVAEGEDTITAEMLGRAVGA